MRDAFELLVGASLYLGGAFTLTLGIVHFFLPLLLDFTHAIPADGAPLKPLKLRSLSYATTRSDIRGIAWVMNHAASYTLVTIGALDLFWTRWLDARAGAWLVVWIAGWWLLRAAAQFYLGRRRGDWLIAAGFIALGAAHIAALALR